MNILVAAAILLSVFSGVCKSLNETAKLVLSAQEIGQNHRNTALHQLEKQKLSMEIEKLELENAELKEKLAEKQKAVQNKGINLSEANLEAQDFDPLRLL